MLAVGMLRDKLGVHTFEIPMPEIKQPDEVLIRLKEVGLDGTDFNIVRYGLQDLAEGRNEIVLGHEGVGAKERRGDWASPSPRWGWIEEVEGEDDHREVAARCRRDPNASLDASERKRRLTDGERARLRGIFGRASDSSELDVDRVWNTPCLSMGGK